MRRSPLLTSRSCRRAGGAHGATGGGEGAAAARPIRRQPAPCRPQRRAHLRRCIRHNWPRLVRPGVSPSALSSTVFCIPASTCIMMTLTSPHRYYWQTYHDGVFAHLSSLQQGILASALPAGAALGGVTGGPFADWCGRRRTLFYTGVCTCPRSGSPAQHRGGVDTEVNSQRSQCVPSGASARPHHLR